MIATPPPPDRRLHELENKDFSPLQASKLKKQMMRDRLALFICDDSIHMMSRLDQ